MPQNNENLHDLFLTRQNRPTISRTEMNNSRPSNKHRIQFSHRWPSSWLILTLELSLDVRCSSETDTKTDTHLMASFPGHVGTRPFWIVIKQGWKWHQLDHMHLATSSHHSVFYRPDALPDVNCQCQSTEDKLSENDKN